MDKLSILNQYQEGEADIKLLVEKYQTAKSDGIYNTAYLNNLKADGIKAINDLREQITQQAIEQIDTEINEIVNSNDRVLTDGELDRLIYIMDSTEELEDLAELYHKYRGDVEFEKVFKASLKRRGLDYEYMYITNMEVDPRLAELEELREQVGALNVLKSCYPFISNPKGYLNGQLQSVDFKTIESLF